MTEWQLHNDAKETAEHIVDNCLEIATSVIAMDPLHVFVYLDPRSDDKRPIKRRSSEPKRQSTRNSQTPPAENALLKRVSSAPNLTNENSGRDLNKTNLSKSKSLLIKSYGSYSVERKIRSNLSHRRSPKKRASYFVRDSIFSEQSLRQDSISSYLANKFPFIMDEPFNTNYDEDAPDDYPVSLRSTLEDILFTEKSFENLKPPSLWSYALSETDSSSESEDDINMVATEEEINALINFEWQTIANFSISETIYDIRNFVSMWKLSENTKFVIFNDTPVVKSILGTKYFLTISFSKPTPKCPNPLAVAYVIFEIYVSFVMPSDFPIMITYHFEGYKTNYHLMGRHNMRSITFQSYFIEAILNMKLSFYAEIFEYNWGSLSAKPQEFTDEEENQLFDEQAKLDEQRYKQQKDKQQQEQVNPITPPVPLTTIKSIVLKVYEQNPPKQTFWDIVQNKHLVPWIDNEEYWKIDVIRAASDNRNMTLQSPSHAALDHQSDIIWTKSDILSIKDPSDVFSDGLSVFGFTM